MWSRISPETAPGTIFRLYTLDGHIELKLSFTASARFAITTINVDNDKNNSAKNNSAKNNSNNNSNNNNDNNENNNNRRKRDSSVYQWTHHCYQFQNIHLASIYRNGELVTDHSSSQDNKLSNNMTIATMYVGGDGFSGEVSSIYVYRKSLNGREVQDSYQKREPMNDVIFVWWSFVL